MPMNDVIAGDIAARVDSGQLQPGDKLPSTTELCRLYAVSSIVVRNALLRLKVKGLVRGVPGVGVFVAERVGEAR